MPDPINGLPDDQGPWWVNPSEIAVLGRWLEQNGRLPDDVWGFVEKVHNWHEERQSMLRDEALDRALDEEEAFEDDLKRRGWAA